MEFEDLNDDQLFHVMDDLSIYELYYLSKTSRNLASRVNKYFYFKSGLSDYYHHTNYMKLYMEISTDYNFAKFLINNYNLLSTYMKQNIDVMKYHIDFTEFLYPIINECINKINENVRLMEFFALVDNGERTVDDIQIDIGEIIKNQVIYKRGTPNVGYELFEFATGTIGEDTLGYDYTMDEIIKYIQAYVLFLLDRGEFIDKDLYDPEHMRVEARTLSPRRIRRGMPVPPAPVPVPTLRVPAPIDEMKLDDNNVDKVRRLRDM